MVYDFHKKIVMEVDSKKPVAIATYEEGAKVIADALNRYFDKRFTGNEAVEMMHKNTSDSLKKIADLAEEQKMEADELIDYMREVSEDMAAQALVVSMRDELKFGKPVD